jgi:hypothetical protein
VVLAERRPADLCLRGRLRSEDLDEIAEWAGRAWQALLTTIGIRRHPLRWRRSPSRTTIGRVLTIVDGDVLDRAVSAYLTDRHEATGEYVPGGRRAIAVDGKALKGSAHLTTARRHLLTVVTHDHAVTLAQAEVAAKTNETVHF